MKMANLSPLYRNSAEESNMAEEYTVDDAMLILLDRRQSTCGKCGRKLEKDEPFEVEINWEAWKDRIEDGDIICLNCQKNG